MSTNETGGETEGTGIDLTADVDAIEAEWADYVSHYAESLLLGEAMHQAFEAQATMEWDTEGDVIDGFAHPSTADADGFPEQFDRLGGVDSERLRTVATNAAESVAAEMLTGVVKTGTLDGMRYVTLHDDGSVADVDFDALAVALQSEVTDALAPTEARDRPESHANALFANSADGGNAQSRSERTTSAGTLADHVANDRGPGDTYAANTRDRDHDRPRLGGSRIETNSREPSSAGTLADHRRRHSRDHTRDRREQGESDHVSGGGSATDRRTFDNADRGVNAAGDESNEDEGGDDHATGYGTLRAYRNAASDTSDERRTGVTMTDGRAYSTTADGETSTEPPTHLSYNGQSRKRGSKGYRTAAMKLLRAGRWRPGWEIPGYEDR